MLEGQTVALGTGMWTFFDPENPPKAPTRSGSECVLRSGVIASSYRVSWALSGEPYLKRLMEDFPNLMDLCHWERAHKTKHLNMGGA